MAFISFEDVTFATPTQYFANLNLSIEKGEFVSIIGKTGCGKSTLLRMLLGSEKPTSGRVVVDGKVVNHPSRDPWLCAAKVFSISG